MSRKKDVVSYNNDTMGICFKFDMCYSLSYIKATGYMRTDYIILVMCLFMVFYIPVWYQCYVSMMIYNRQLRYIWMQCRVKYSKGQTHHLRYPSGI